MAALIVTLIFVGIPLIAFIFFIVSLVRFCMARRRIKTEPESISAQDMKKCKTLLIVSSIILVVLLAVIIGFVALIYMSIAYM